MGEGGSPSGVPPHHGSAGSKHGSKHGLQKGEKLLAMARGAREERGHERKVDMHCGRAAREARRQGHEGAWCGYGSVGTNRGRAGVGQPAQRCPAWGWNEWGVGIRGGWEERGLKGEGTAAW